MNKSHKKHFVFDLDDTLTDSYEFNQQMFVESFSPYLDITRKKTEKYLRDLHYCNRGASMTLQFSMAINKYSLNVRADKLVKDNEKLHICNLQCIKMFDAVEDFIKILKANNKKVYICSNRQMSSLVKIINNNGIGKHLDRIISCGDEGHEKPDPYCLKKLINKAKDIKEKFIYFGDSKTDYEFAQNAGIDCVIIDHYLNDKKFYLRMLESFL